MWLLSFVALVGFPPFPIFLSKFFMILALWQTGHRVLAVLFILFLTIILYGMGRSILPMSLGECRPEIAETKFSYCSYCPQIVFLLILIWVGVAMPDALHQLLQKTVAAF